MRLSPTQSLYLTYYSTNRTQRSFKYLGVEIWILFLKTSSNILRIEISKIRTNITLLVITNNVFGILLLLLQLTLQYCDYNRKHIL